MASLGCEALATTSAGCAFAMGRPEGQTVGLPGMALAIILRQGGAAYLSRHVAAAHLAAGRLHEVSGAPTFRRLAYMVQRDAPREERLQRHAADLVRAIVAEASTLPG